MGQAADDHKRTGGRVLLVYIAAHFVVTFAVLSVGDVSRRHHHVIKRTTGGFQNRLDVFEHLTRLSFDISLADDVAILIRSGLSRDKKHFAALGENALRISRPRIVRRLWLNGFS